MSQWLKVELDEETGAVTARAFASAQYGPEGKERDVVVHRDVAVPEEVAKPLTQLLQAVLASTRADLTRDARKARAAAESVAENNGEFDDDGADEAPVSE